MTDDHAARRRRAKERAQWPGSLGRVEDMPAIERVEGDPAELMAMVIELSARAWELSGRPFPAYTRATMPGRVLRHGSPRGDDEVPDVKSGGA